MQRGSGKESRVRATRQWCQEGQMSLHRKARWNLRWLWGAGAKCTAKVYGAETESVKAD